MLGVQPDARADAIEQAFRQQLKTAHPDVGGTHDEMARLNIARDAGLRAVGA